jgi:hypothetical protein
MRKVEEGWSSDSFREQGSRNTIANTVSTKVLDHEPVTISLLLKERKYRGAASQNIACDALTLVHERWDTIYGMNGQNEGDNEATRMVAENEKLMGRPSGRSVGVDPCITELGSENLEMRDSGCRRCKDIGIIG